MFVPDKSIALNDVVTLREIEPFFDKRLKEQTVKPLNRQQEYALHNRFSESSDVLRVVCLDYVVLDSGDVLVKYGYIRLDDKQETTAYSVITKRGIIFIIHSFDAGAYFCDLFVCALNDAFACFRPLVCDEVINEEFALSTRELAELTVLYNTKGGDAR